MHTNFRRTQGIGDVILKPYHALMIIFLAASAYADFRHGPGGQLNIRLDTLLEDISWAFVWFATHVGGDLTGSISARDFLLTAEHGQLRSEALVKLAYRLRGASHNKITKS